MSSKDSLLGGRYRVERVLGSGGMATVFLCKDERLGRSVAVKRLHAHSPEETAQRFVREAKLGASLNHPNLVSVFDTVTDEESVLIVMEHVDGENLADALRRGPLGTDRAMDVIGDVAAALDHAHSSGVIHRDIKPANVLLRKDGMTKLVDLGIATAADQTQITRSGVVLGTAAYMAPEQIEGGETGPHTDIYSLAVVAYEALSGKRARSGRTPMEIAHQVATDGPPDLQEVWSQAPPDAAAVLCRAMDPDPGRRPATAGEFAGELEDALEGVEDTRPTRRGSAAAAAGGAAAGAAAGAGAAAAADGDDPTAQQTPQQLSADPEQAGAAAASREADPPARAASREAEPRGARPAPSPSREAPSREQPPARRPAAAAPASGRKGRPGLAIGLAALLLALAAIVAIAALSGGDDPQKAGGGAQDTAQDTETQPEQTGTDEQPGTEQEQPTETTQSPPTGGGNDPAQGARLDAQAYGLIQQGKYEEAVPIARRAVASFPENDTSANHAYALFNLGTALNRSGSPKEAIPYLEKRLSFSNDRREVVQKELDSARRNAGG